jgi:glycyl-tRNA synthetase alpha subunit
MFDGNSIGVTERTSHILRVRQLPVAIANACIEETVPKATV